MPIAVVVALFAIAATGVQTTAGAPSHHSRSSLLSVGQWLIGFAILGGLTLLVVGLVTMRGLPRVPRRPTSITALIAYLVVGVAVLFLLASGRHGALLHGPRAHPSAPARGASGAPTGGAARELPSFPWVGFLVTVAFLAVVSVVTFLILERGRPRGASRPRARTSDPEVQADDDTLLALARDGEPRAAVRAAYELARRALARDGVGPEEWEAPGEYAARVAAERPEHGRALRDLTTRYERARFSAAAVVNDDRRVAFATVERLRAAVAARAEPVAVVSAWE